MDWVCIYTSSKPQNAEMIKALLTHNEINSVVVSKQDSFYKFGEYEVYVNRDDVVKAKFCLSQTSSEGEGSNS
ncbi:MAG: DUF2007 domain-containing protein [Bacteroidetes bacterium]|nr:DUF2007 domain-containing protein [Bacteroidota bacterium]